MGCSYYITCKKCESAATALYDLDLEDVAETLREDAGFHLDDFGSNNLIDPMKLLGWIEKHRGHGEIEFNIQC